MSARQDSSIRTKEVRHIGIIVQRGQNAFQHVLWLRFGRLHRGVVGRDVLRHSLSELLLQVMVTEHQRYARVCRRLR